MFGLMENGFTFAGVTDVIILLVLAYFVYRKIRKTEALKILIGITVIFALAYFTGQLGLVTTSAVLERAIDLLLLGLVVIFHPELRMALKKIGGIADITPHEGTKVVEALEDAVFQMASTKTGALILLDYDKTIAQFSENQTPIDALCTAELLQTIFYPKSRLHDGAVLIQEDRIAYAGCKLPITGRKRENLGHLGTRHLAAFENVERFKALAIVVSEETGNISIVTGEGLFRVKSREMFRKFFEEEKEKKVWLEKIIKRN